MAEAGGTRGRDSDPYQRTYQLNVTPNEQNGMSLLFIGVSPPQSEGFPLKGAIHQAVAFLSFFSGVNIMGVAFKKR